MSDTLIAERAAADTVRGLLPVTIDFVKSFLADPGRRACIPRSSLSGEQGDVWPNRQLDDEGRPWHTLLQLGDVDGISWHNSGGSSFRQLDNGLILRSSLLGEKPGHGDDFSLTIDRGPNEPGVNLHVYYRLEDAAGSSKIGVAVCDLNDGDLSRLVGRALDARYRGVATEDALTDLREIATGMGAMPFGLSLRMPSRVSIDLDTTDADPMPTLALR